MSPYRLGVDVGGTHTDLVLLDTASGELLVEKVASTPKNPALGVLDGVSRFIARGVAPDDIGFFAHGTTITTNALLEMRGAKVGLLITKGYRAVQEIQNQARDGNLFDYFYAKPAPIAPQSLTKEILERCDHAGNVLQPLDRDAVRQSAHELKAAGVDISKVNYVAAGWPQWGTTLKEGKGDTALSWEGLRAQWKGQGLDFDYILGRNFSKLPANTFVIRKADFDDPGKRKVYASYLKGWAAGLEFGRMNPRAATQIVMEQFPGLSSQMNPSVATESQMQLANVFAGRWDERKKWGFHILESWKLFFDTGRAIGQITGDFKLEDVVKNDLVDDANAFDAAKVKADSDGFKLADAYAKVDVDAIQKAL